MKCRVIRVLSSNIISIADTNSVKSQLKTHLFTGALKLSAYDMTNLMPAGIFFRVDTKFLMRGVLE